MRPRTAPILVALLAGSGLAAADSRVAVPPFAGPSDAAAACHAAVIDAVSIGHEVVDPGEIARAAGLSDSDASNPQIAGRLAELTGADGFIVGRVAETDTGYALTLLARELDSEAPASAMIVSLASEELGAEERRSILAFAMRAIRDDAEIDDLADGDIDAGAGDEVIDRETATTPPPSFLRWTAAVGLGASARRLSFNAEPGLARSPGLSGNPSAGLRLESELGTRATPGVGVAASYERAVGARLAAPGGFQLPVNQTRWSVAARGRLAYRGLEIAPSVGYGEIGYRLEVRPANVLVPDARYGYIEAGAEARYQVGPAALFGGGRYLHPVSIGGITDPATFGGASVRGFAATAGLAFRAADRVWIRVTARYLRFALAFDGTGEMALGLDDDPELDVFGAIDAFAGGDASVVFTL